MVKETLRKLGMTKNEVDVYITLLNSGEMSVNEIGSRSGLHRQVCYDALERLLEKGFVSFVKKKNKKHFKPLYPDRIIDYLEEKKNQVRNILPQLKIMYDLEKEETSVEVIKGKTTLRTILIDIFRTLKETKGPLCIMGVEETKFLEFDRIAIKQHILRMKKNKLKEKLLSKESATKKIRYKLQGRGAQSEQSRRYS